VPAVQAAVDRGGSVILKGHFSFDAPPTNPIVTDLLPFGIPAKAEVRIRNAVTVSGTDDERGEMTTIDAGSIPFYVEAAGQDVAIRRLRFVRPTSLAMLVFAVRALDIVSNRVEGLKTFGPALNGAVGILTVGGIPNAAKPGKPGNVSGNVIIAHNDFDVRGGTNTENVLGITVFSIGDSTTPVDVRVSENRIENSTEPAINFRRVVGRVSIDHNVLKTGTIGVADARGEVIRVANLGTYVVAHNLIDCEWPLADAEGIGVFSQISAWPIEHALVVDNHITMAAPAGTAFSDFSGGIGVFGFANANVVQHNIIRGSARAGITMPVFPLSPQAPAAPTGNQLIENRFYHFTPAVADIFVGSNAVGTVIVGRGTVVDQGSGTMLEQGDPRADRPRR
jgi:hypothetical protein